ncbi:probable DEAD-box ATP-dependent RNA helicase 48 isoform X1 [Prosopis cineraria]|uniref:probable DEAD-box ATP-dependent RNA helicase 48 isoform X1 n=1 Tax=Prosopis cineraria TaxID=364024 RepID=UPI00240EB0F2|nr:probable DEAD-box ATP-dependent RNA helicase 48 isoform X1 [Prosopis cineraria]
MYSLIVTERSSTLSKILCNFILARNMGGGPRTFPGGVSKWKWKRMHEKRARDKERRLLDQEKQLYQARIRSHIRAKLAAKPDTSSATHSPMAPEDHIKALANRFMKEGAEDLWNRNDGPLKPPPPRLREFPGSSRRRGSIASPVDLRKLVLEGRRIFSDRQNDNLMNTSSNYTPTRNYSTQSRRKFQKKESSSDEEDSTFGLEGNPARSIARNSFSGQKTLINANAGEFINEKKNIPKRPRKLWRDDSSSGESESDMDSDGLGIVRGGNKIGSSASLGKYDVKTRRRMPPKSYDEESDLSEQVELIRYELNKRKMAEYEQHKSEEDALLGQKRFDECGISPLTIKALSSAGYIRMTRVQEASLSVCLEGKDALVKAKTGTGKSAAFLLPAIETVLKAMSINAPQRVPPIRVLILCPTRELATQITAELKVLLKYHDGIGVQTLIGGIRFKDDQKRLESDPSQIIVATPGRLLDHIEYKSGISLRLMGLQMLILDEADHLLDLGFRKSVEKLVDCLPRQRQSLLFSATIPKEVRRISQLVLKRDHTYIDTVGINCVETPVKVKQSYLVAPHESHFQILHHILKEHILQAPDYKVIVFCTTGMVTSLLYQLLREMKMNVREIHSRKPQLYRTRMSDEFRESKQLILVSSDVSSRGMNYPDVSLVIQVGIPTDREQYIHRVGRTGREGKEGECILLIAPWEEYFLDEIKDLPLTRFPLPDIDPETKLQVENSMAKIDNDVKESAYHTWLGYYNSIREIGRDKTTLAELANQFSESIGLQRPPALFRKTALKMGLKDIPGFRIRR